MTTIAATLALALLALTPPDDPAKVPEEAAFLFVPLRVHVLTGKGSDLLNCTLTDDEIRRLVGRLNAIWHKGGMHFGLESIVREPAAQVERFATLLEQNDNQLELGAFQVLLPRSSRGVEGLNLYLFRDLPLNGASYYDDAVIISQAGTLREVEGGTDGEISRVIAHTIARLLNAKPVNEPSRLLALGTTGTALAEDEAARVRRVARGVPGVVEVAALRKAAEAAEAKGDLPLALRDYNWLAEVPGPSAAAAKAKAAAIAGKIKA